MYKLIALAILLSSCAAGYSNQQVDTAKPTEVASLEDYSEVSVDEFAAWKDGFKTRAVNSGISANTVTRALKIAKPIDRVIELDRKQPEHKLTMEQYMANVINDARIERGRELLQEHSELLNRISKQYGVEPEFIVALWGLETSYGKNTGGFNILSSIATLAYEGRRREFFESELISALLIIEQGHIEPSDMKGSWAGAMGQCQFMPSSYLAYAVDYDGDGKKDIWGNKKDVFASIANYLNTVGWGPSYQQKERTLKHWNRSSYFVASVFKLAEEIADEG